jgi:hypothetical protein
MLVPSAQATLPPHSKFIYLSMLNNAWREYERQTNIQIVFHPITAHLQMCSTPAEVLTTLESQVDLFDGSRRSDERLRQWLKPFVSVLFAFSGALGKGLTLVRTSSLGVMTLRGQTMRDMRRRVSVVQGDQG